MTDSAEPKNCWECRELFVMDNMQIVCCPNVYSIKGLEFDKIKTSNRKAIYDFFSAEVKKLKLPDMCRNCIYMKRKNCDGLCFRGEA